MIKYLSKCSKVGKKADKEMNEFFNKSAATRSIT